jgi:TatD DNase family protein
VFHGFNKRTELANKILDQGYYLSFGKHLLMDAYDEVFKEIPLDKIFLETDDDSIAIETVYRKAAEIKQLDLVLLTEQISENYRMVFGGLKTTQNE